MEMVHARATESFDLPLAPGESAIIAGPYMLTDRWLRENTLLPYFVRMDLVRMNSVEESGVFVTVRGRALRCVVRLDRLLDTRNQLRMLRPGEPMAMQYGQTDGSAHLVAH